MARTSIDRDSVEYLKVPITAPADVTLGTQTVEMAVLSPETRPIEDDWNTAEWADSTTARLLLGPGALPLAAGTYKVWLRLTDTPEVPVLTAGTITVL